MSIYDLYKILSGKEKSISIKNIFKDIVIEEKDKNDLEQYNNFKYNKNMFLGDNSYFIKEFNIDIEDEKMINMNDEKEDNNINNEIQIKKDD